MIYACRSQELHSIMQSGGELSSKHGLKPSLRSCLMELPCCLVALPPCDLVQEQNRLIFQTTLPSQHLPPPLFAQSARLTIFGDFFHSRSRSFCHTQSVS